MLPKQSNTASQPHAQPAQGGKAMTGADATRIQSSQVSALLRGLRG